MKVEYRSLPYAGEKASTISIGAGSLKEVTSQEMKRSPSPRRMAIPQHTVCSSGSSCSILDDLAVRGRDVKNAQDDVSEWLREIGITEVKI